jgi:hypothetical protein
MERSNLRWYRETLSDDPAHRRALMPGICWRQGFRLPLANAENGTPLYRRASSDRAKCCNAGILESEFGRSKACVEPPSRPRANHAIR